MMRMESLINSWRLGGVGLHLRNQIYQIIADFEGVSLTDSGYLWGRCEVT